LTEKKQFAHSAVYSHAPLTDVTEEERQRDTQNGSAANCKIHKQK